MPHTHDRPPDATDPGTPPVNPVADPLAETTDPTTTPPRPPAAQRDPARQETITRIPGAGVAETLSPEEAVAALAAVHLPGFHIESQLGHGGMGVVYKAHQVKLNRVVAIKVILGGPYASPEARVRFLSEAEAIAHLHHPNIVQVYEFGQHEGFPYFTLEYLEGGTLERRLNGTPIDPIQAAKYVHQLASAVQHAHDRGVIHRDLKPSNILLDLNGVLKISDFGLAKQTEGGSGMTQSGSILGTPSYMAPEQAAGHIHEIGRHSDIYALGAILYDCLCGRPPFRGSTQMETINQVLLQEPVAPRRLVGAIPRELETICLKCLQKSPAGRYASSGDLATDLQRFLDGEPIAARPIGRSERALRWAKRHPSTAALVGVIATAIVALFGLGVWHNISLKKALDVAENRRLEAERLSGIAENRRIDAETQKGIAEERRQEAETQKGIAEERRREAETQKGIAEERRQEAEKQKALVAANLQHRLDAVDDMLINLDGRLAQKNGMQPVRMEFLNEFLKLSKQLLQEQGDDPKVRRQAARVYAGIGELNLDGRRFREGEAAYAQAADLHKKLTAQFPDNIEYQTDYATTCLRRSLVLAIGQQYEKARASVAEAVAVTETLLKRDATNAEFRQRAARYRYYLANFLEELGKTDEARAVYDDVLARQAAMVKESPKKTEYLRDQATFLTAFALMQEKSAPDAAYARMKDALLARCRIAKPNPQDRAASTALHEAIADTSAFCRRNGRHADLAAAADAVVASFPNSRMELYNGACLYGHCSAMAAADKALAPEARRKALDAYAVRALELLEKAVEAGFTDRAHLATDPDLDPFRDRAEFSAFFDRVATRFPGQRDTPALRLEALQQMHRYQDDRATRLSDTAITVAQKKRAEFTQPDFCDIGKRVLALAEKNAAVPAALEALVWIVETAPAPATSDRQLTDLMRQTLKALQRDHMTKPEFVNACRALANFPLPEGDQILEAAQGSTAPADVRGKAAYALALSLSRRAEAVENTDPAKAMEFTARAEKQFEIVARDHSAVSFGSTTLGETVRKKLIELRTLSVGRTAHDIEGADLTGKVMKLSDFRGKVVLLDFWANWCGYCRMMYPHERQMVERLKDKPFVLLGVNCDEDLAVANRAVDREKLNWRSWFDATVAGGRATEKWQVSSFPSLYLLDQNGVIRRKWQGAPDPDELDAAIARLFRQ